MVKLTVITTKKGDDGSTGLGDNTRVSKSTVRIALIGQLDTTNAVIGLLRLQTGNHKEDSKLLRIQNDLLDVGADVCIPKKEQALRITADYVEKLEEDMSRLKVLPLKSFLLPGGSIASSWCHLGRAHVRTAERLAVALSEQEGLNKEVIRYLNRLSDYLFVVARHFNKGNDILWKPGG